MHPSQMTLKELLRCDCDNEHFLAISAKIGVELYTEEDLENCGLQYEGQIEDLEGENYELRAEIDELEEKIKDLEVQAKHKEGTV